MSRHGDERSPCPNDDWLGKVHSAAFTRSGRGQQAQPLAGAGVDAKHRHLLPGLDALQVATGDEPVIGKAEGEMRLIRRAADWNETRDRSGIAI